MIKPNQAVFCKEFPLFGKKDMEKEWKKLMTAKKLMDNSLGGRKA